MIWKVSRTDGKWDKRQMIEEGMRKFQDSLEESSSYEENLFKYFVASMNLQNKALGLEKRPLHPDLRKRLLAFEELLRRFV